MKTTEKNYNNKYDILFSTDWNKGNDSKMRSMDRCEMNVLYLEYLHNKYSTPTKIEPVVPDDVEDNENEIQGFVKF